MLPLTVTKILRSVVVLVLAGAAALAGLALVANEPVLEITYTDSLAAPSGLAATASSESQINLSWTDNATNEDAYTVERSTDGTNFTVLSSTLPANTASYKDEGLSASTTYYYRVKATNADRDSTYSDTVHATTLLFSDDFDRETDEFVPPWSEVDRAAPDRLTTDSAVKRKGTHSAKFTVRDSDLLGYSNPRAQLNWLEKFCEGDERYIGWSTMLPSDFPATLPSGAWINIMQVGFGPPWGYPPLIFSYYGSKISVRNDSGGNGNRTQVASFTPTRGAWQDVVMRVKFSKSSSIGYVEMWVNGEQLSMANGQTRQYMNTLRPDATGCGSLMPTLYRSEGSWEWLTLYHDEVKVGNTYADVAP